jgi:hypothetical protein
MPFYRTSIRSALSKEDSENAIRELLVSRESAEGIDFGSHRGRAEFIGDFLESKFSMRRIIGYQNSFLPKISARVASEHGGCRVVLMMYLSPFMAAFMLFLFFTAGRLLVNSVTAGQFSGAPFWMPVGLMTFGLVLLLAGFFGEAFKAKLILARVLAGET